MNISKYQSINLLIVTLCLALTGCAGLTPAFGGKTNYNVEFTDTLEGQSTTYKMAISAPAGTELDSITGMTYNWNPDQSGAISVSNNGTLNTQGQAALQAQYTTQQFEAFTNAFTQALSTIAPLVGTKIQTDSQKPPKVDAITADEIRMLIESLATK